MLILLFLENTHQLLGNIANGIDCETYIRGKVSLEELLHRFPLLLERLIFPVEWSRARRLGSEHPLVGLTLHTL